MEYVGNYADIIKDEWITFLLSNSGKLLPDDKMEVFSCNDHYSIVSQTWDIANRATWYKFEIDDLNFTIPWPVKLTDNIDWWVVKQLPGQCIPIHSDPNDQLHTTRYIMMLQDYLPGHLLLWNDVLIKDYKKGDLYKIVDVNSYHGSSNISNEPRIIAHLTVWN